MYKSIKIEINRPNGVCARLVCDSVDITVAAAAAADDDDDGRASERRRENERMFYTKNIILCVLCKIWTLQSIAAEQVRAYTERVFFVRALKYIHTQQKQRRRDTILVSFFFVNSFTLFTLTLGSFSILKQKLRPKEIAHHVLAHFTYAKSFANTT